MFRADIRAMGVAADELQRQIRIMNREISETESVISGLNGLSGMDGVKRKLRNQVERLVTQRYQLLKLMTTLQQATRCYGLCEQNIIRYAEDNKRKHAGNFEWIQVSVTPNVSRMLKQIIY